jgi:hypothetical protein
MYIGPPPPNAVDAQSARGGLQAARAAFRPTTPGWRAALRLDALRTLCDQ